MFNFLFRKKQVSEVIKPESTATSTIKSTSPKLVANFRVVQKMEEVKVKARDIIFHMSNGESVKYTSKSFLSPPFYFKNTHYGINLVDNSVMSAFYDYKEYELLKNNDLIGYIVSVPCCEGPTIPLLTNRMFSVDPKNPEKYINLSQVVTMDVGPIYELEETLSYEYVTTEPINKIDLETK
jgi:hypothetical protein